ncbi:MAG: GguC protein, partial [Edaphobacter sp.]
MIHLVQIGNGTSRRVAVVDEPHLRCLDGVESVYELAQSCLRSGKGITEHVQSLAHGESLDYDAVYKGSSEWYLLTPIDVPGSPSRTLVAGTGLTHLGSAKDRQAMHKAESAKAAETMTDSMRMFQWGVEGGRPTTGTVGIAPEWFYKGNGSVLRAPF